MAEGDEKKAPPVHEAGDTRRDFLKTAGIGGIGLGLGAVVAGPAVAFVGFPLTHATVWGGEDFLEVGRSDLFKEGQPVKVDVFANRRDAWNRVVQVKVGSAWMLRKVDKIVAYSTVCPHLGCAIDFDAAKFACPCHKSVFAMDGKVQGGPSPRGMDELEVAEKDGAVAIKYVRYRQGVPEKETV